jgi:hypothetical protein
MAKKTKGENKITPKKPKKYSGDKLRLLPGISEAIDLVREHAFTRAIFEAIEVGTNGKLGNKARNVINKDTITATDDFLGLEVVESYINDTFDEWLELFAYKASSKIAELWSLSEAAGLYLPQLIYWSEYDLSLSEIDFPLLVFLMNAEGDKDIKTLKEHNQEFRKKGFVVISAEQIQKGHIYLDVTELTYPSLRSAYKTITLCRKYLGIKKKDLQAGAPSKIDTQKALNAVYLKHSLKSSKDIAKQLGFKIYSSDNPSGSYPLLYKYLKIGSKVEDRLVKLDKFLSSITIKASN